jgi:DNA replication protein DnaD
LEGYIKLHRKIRESALWLELTRFDKRSAWVDMLLRVNHKDRSVVIGNKIFHIEKGQFITSQLHLAEAWHWNKETVKVFLDLLVSLNQIRYKASNKFTIITIRNWDIYQNSVLPKPATKPTPKQHQNGINSSTNNNEKNENNEKNIKHIFIMKSHLLQLCEQYKKDKILVKQHLLKKGYTEFQVEEAFHKYLNEMPNAKQEALT